MEGSYTEHWYSQVKLLSEKLTTLTLHESKFMQNDICSYKSLWIESLEVFILLKGLAPADLGEKLFFALIFIVLCAIIM